MIRSTKLSESHYNKLRILFSCYLLGITEFIEQSDFCLTSERYARNDQY